MKKRILIVGGVAGGASTAARLRRLDAGAEIVMLERGPFVSFANCGLPYHVSDVIADEASLTVASPQLFRERHGIEVRTGHEVVSIDAGEKTVRVRVVASGEEVEERYDALVLSPGASPVRPPLPGIDLPGILTLRNIPDVRKIREWIRERGVKRAIVAGAGFIGLEMVENLHAMGIEVTVLEMLPQVMPPLDAEMAWWVAEHLRSKGVTLALGDGVAAFEATESGGLAVRTAGGVRHEGDMVILSIGVRPETGLAKAAGLELGPRGGIRVDDRMRTSDPSIWAVGDAVEVVDRVSGQPALIPLAGPANRQARIAAAAICGHEARFSGVQGTAICGVLGLTVAATGASEKALERAGEKDYEKVYLHPANHATYYPGASSMHLKVVYRTTDGRLLGAQAVGGEGVDKRMDVLAVFLQMGATVHDLAEAELCYAPQYGSAKDPVNIAGMAAVNALEGLSPLTHWNSPRDGALLVDVREEDEFEEGHAEEAVNLPLSGLRERWRELPAGRELHVYCGVGLRAHNAVRFLRQQGYAAWNLSGGWKSYAAAKATGKG
jgi:NADPH-dependent 2,4-dienoyl-CoA reductase/sulfur reductase-like enzyme/rhodanese-related sulfurtransferase